MSLQQSQHCLAINRLRLALQATFGSYEGKILLTATGITSSYGGGMKIVPEAIIDDGLFDVCIIEPVPRRTVCACFSPFSGEDMPDIPRYACAAQSH